MRVGSIPSGARRYGKYARGLSQELWDLREQDALKISHFLHLRAEVCSETLVEELDEFGPEDRVGHGVHYGSHTPVSVSFGDMDKLETYLKGKYAMDDDTFLQHVAQLKGLRDRNGELHEVETVKAACRFGAVLASHDDTTEDQVKVSARSRHSSGRVPHHGRSGPRLPQDHDIQGDDGRAEHNPRAGRIQEMLLRTSWPSLGHLDILSSDYVPSALLLSAVTAGRDLGRYGARDEDGNAGPGSGGGVGRPGRVARRRPRRCHPLPDARGRTRPEFGLGARSTRGVIRRV